jgi:hypothetical protein
MRWKTDRTGMSADADRRGWVIGERKPTVLILPPNSHEAMPVEYVEQLVISLGKLAMLSRRDVHQSLDTNCIEMIVRAAHG